MITAGKRKYSNISRKYSEDVSDLSFIVEDNDPNNICDSNEYYFEKFPPNSASRKNSCYILQQSDDKNQMKNSNIIYVNQDQNSNEPKYLLIEKAFQDYAILDQIDESESSMQELTQLEWEDIFQEKKIDPKLIYKLSNSLFKGISYENRIRLWPILANVEYLEQIQYGTEIKDCLFKTPCHYENQIDNDIVQSIILIENTMKSQNKSLNQIQKILPDLLMQTKRICRAYAHFDKEVGYVQGMCSIIIAIIKFMHPDNDKEFQDTYFVFDKKFERTAFWIFVHIMYQKQWRTLFLDGQPGLSIISKNIEKKMQEYLPTLNKHIQNLGISYRQLFGQDLFTLFQQHTNKSLGKRMLDMFLLDGEEIFYSVYLVIIKTFEKKLLGLNNRQAFLKYVKEDMKNEWYDYYNNISSTLNFDEYQNQLNQILYTQIQF